MDIEKLTELLKKAQGNRSQNEFALHSEVSSATITKILKSERFPSPKILKKLANKAHNGVTYEQLMQAAGHVDSEVIEAEEDYDNFLECCKPICGSVLSRLRELRLSRNITVEELCEKFKVNKRVVSQWETGFIIPDTKTIIALADYFDVSVDYLLGRSNIPYIADDILKNSLNNKVYDKFVKFLDSIKQQTT